jgi:GT2 family glycosyltransferase
MKIAVLLACHNRKDKTISCLNSLFKANLFLNYSLEVYLVDDASIDGTSKAITNFFPSVNIIKGNGNLYWNQGMRLAWKTSVKKNIPDFFIWLNDDTNIDVDALLHLFECYNEYISINSTEVIIVGSCRNKIDEDKYSYGLRKNHVKIIPNGKIQNGNMLNGNLVLISKAVYTKLGILSNCYTHAMGDYDYGLRALENGIQLITTKKYIATCESNIGLPKWCDPRINFFNRWKVLHTPLGLNIKEYKIYRKRFWPKNYIMSISKVYLRCLMPSFYNKISRNEK